MNILFGVSAFLLLLFLEGFFSGSEIAIISADPKYIQGKGKEQVLKFLQNPEYLLAVTLVGTNLCVVTNTALTTAFLLKALGNKGELVSIFCLPPILLIFGEVIPKSICRRYADYIAPKLAYSLKIASFFLTPLVFIFARITKTVLSSLGAKDLEKKPFFTKEELRFLIQKDELEINLSPKERNLLNRLFSFTEKEVKKAMIPLVEVVSIPETATIAEAIELFSRYHYSRLPVYRKRVDQIIGIIHFFDILFVKDTQQPIKPYIKPAFFVPETKPVHLLLKEMQQYKQPLAVVVDEYGGAVGIVHIEDVLEEVTGEIMGEDEIAPVFYQKLDRNRYLIKARMEIEAINEQLPFSLPKGDYETLNGFIIDYLGRIPKEGETFCYKNLKFIIRKAQPRRIEEVEVVIA